MNLLQKTARGTAWSFAGAQAVTIGTFATSIVVEHYLSPQELGTYALVALIVGVAGSASTLFAGNFYVITPNPSVRLLRTGVVLELVLGTSLWLLLLAGVAVYVALGGSGEFAGLLAVEGLVLVASAVGSPVGPLAAKFTRDFAYRTPTLVWLGAVLTGVVLKLVLVIAGLGPWALVIGDTALFVFYAVVMLLLVPEGRRLEFDRRLAASLLAFGIPSLLTNVMSLLSERASEFAVAIVLGTHALGIYYLAARLPFQIYQLGGSLSVSLLTAFSRSDERQLQRGFALATRLSAFFVFLPLALVIPLAEPFVTLVYGQAWVAAATPFALLMAAIAVRFTFWHVLNALKSRGRVREIAYLTAVQLAIVSVLSLLGAWAWGLVGAAAATLAVELILVVPKIRLIRTLVPFEFVNVLRAPALTLLAGVALTTVAATSLPGGQALVVSAIGLTALFGLTAWHSDRASLVAMFSAFRRTRFGG